MKRFLLGLLTVMTFVSTAAATEWDIDPQHTNAVFSVRHLMIADVAGMFPDVTGVVNIDENDITKSTVSVNIDVVSIDSGVAKRDEHLKSSDFFEADKFPKMTFVSRKVEQKGQGRLAVAGDLTIRGIANEVVFDVHGPSEAVVDPWGFKRKGLKAFAVINRKDFGIVWNQILQNGAPMIGDLVKITIDLEMVEKK